jgi:aldose sugar dehydrogenase
VSGVASRARALLIGAVVLLLGACQAPTPAEAPPQGTPDGQDNDAGYGQAPPLRGQPPPIEPRVFVDGVALPTALQFAPDGRLFFGEVNKGQVRLVEGGVLRAEPFARLQVAQGREHGLLGVALDPGFSQNRHVYVYYTVPKRNGRPDYNRVVRFTERDGVASAEQVIFDRIPADSKGSHNGGRMAFGPDGKLYVATGAPGDDSRGAQRLEVLEGKILRLNPDGTAPADNPVAGSPVYALGLRNPYGIAFHPRSGQLYAVDNGPKGYDELNLIRAGGNYGSPTVVGAAGDSRFVDPIWQSGSDRLGLAGLTFYSGAQLADYRGDMFMCLWNAGLLRRVRLAEGDGARIEAIEDLAVDCRLDVTDGPDGALYVADIARILRVGP